MSSSKAKLWERVRPGVRTRPSAGRTGAARQPLPCVHEGGVVAACRSCGGGEGRHVRECDVHGRATRVEAGKGVAVCAGCPDYRPDPALLPREPGRVLVPSPPPLDLRPASRTAVVTVAAGDSGRELLAASGSAMERFARRVGADFVVLDWPGHPDWPMSAKFQIPRALDHYDRILYADADVLFRDGCVNPFDLCHPDEFGACDEMVWKLYPQYINLGMMANYERHRRETGVCADVAPPWYLNCGVYVASRVHQPLLTIPAVPVRAYHCGEQDMINARVLAACLAGTLKVRLLDRRANWQNWTDPGFRHAPADAVLHWSGAGSDRGRRVAAIRDAAARPASGSRPGNPAATLGG